MTILLKLNPSTQPVERATSSAPNLLRRVAWPGSGRIFPLPYEAIAVEARSFAREHARLGRIDFGYEHPLD